jgi:hypothetical protein
MMFKEIIPVFSENHTKHINTKLEILNVKADDSLGFRD